jgi:predicted metal-dependent peptidase
MLLSSREENLSLQPEIVEAEPKEVVPPKTGRGSKTTADGSIVDVRGKTITAEQAALNDKFNIGLHFLNLYRDEPFFYGIYRVTDRIMSRSAVPTAGVTVVNGTQTFIWNQDFISSLPVLHVTGLLKHEAYHLIYEHCTHRRRDPHFVWNWATDLSINCNIDETELPEGGLCPGKPLRRPDVDAWNAMGPDEQRRFEALSKLIVSFPPDMEAEWYFERLMEDPTVKEMVEAAEAAEAAAKSLRDAIGRALADAMGMDDHDSWGEAYDVDGEGSELPDSVAQQIGGVLRDAIRETVSRCDGSGRWGSVPAKMQARIRSLISNEVDWKTLLRQFLGRSVRAEARNTHKRVNHKVPYTFPGRTRSRTSKVNVYVDQSGSVHDHALALFYATLRSLAGLATFTFYPFDSEVDEENSFTWKKGDKKPELSRFRCGGTSFQAVVDHANASKGHVDGVIILTDGGCSKPSRCNVRLAYLISPGDKLFFDPDPNDIVIQMTGDDVEDT